MNKNRFRFSAEQNITIATSLLLTLALSQMANAYDWSNDYGVDVTFAADDNFRLTPDDEIDTTSINLRLFTDIEGTTEISHIRLDLAVTGVSYSESSIDDEQGYSLAFDTSRTGERLSTFLNVGFDSDLTNETELLDSGIVEDGTRDTVSVSPGLSYLLNERNTLSANLNFTDVSYDTESQTEYIDNSLSLSWSYGLDEGSSVYTSIQSSVYEPDDDDETDVTSFNVGYENRLSEATTYNISVGYSDVDRPDDSEIGSNFSLDVNHRTDKQNSFTLVLSNSYEGSGQGEVREELGLNLLWARGLSERSQFTWSAEAVHTDDRDFYSTQAGVNYQYIREVNLSASYRYRQRDEGTGDADSSTLLFSISYSPF